MSTKAIISNLREFSRFYTNLVGLLDQNILDSRYTLPEARVLYEIANTAQCTAAVLSEKLSMDKGYLSRILKSFESKRLLERQTHKQDRRSAVIRLTKLGLREFRHINSASEKQFTMLLKGITGKEQKQLVMHMSSIQKILRPSKK